MSTLKYSGFVDRIDGNFVVILISGYEILFPLELIDKEISEGDHLNIIIEKDFEKTNNMKKEVLSLINELTSKNDQEDIVL